VHNARHLTATASCAETGDADGTMTDVPEKAAPVLEG
jgi:hypothetical protein